MRRARRRRRSRGAQLASASPVRQVLLLSTESTVVHIQKSVQPCLLHTRCIIASRMRPDAMRTGVYRADQRYPPVQHTTLSSDEYKHFSSSVTLLDITRSRSSIRGLPVRLSLFPSTQTVARAHALNTSSLAWICFTSDIAIPLR